MLGPAANARLVTKLLLLTCYMMCSEMVNDLHAQQGAPELQGKRGAPQQTCTTGSNFSRTKRTTGSNFSRTKATTRSIFSQMRRTTGSQTGAGGHTKANRKRYTPSDSLHRIQLNIDQEQHRAQFHHRGAPQDPNSRSSTGSQQDDRIRIRIRSCLKIQLDTR